MEIDEILKNKCGIYALYINKKIYIGKSHNLYKRLVQHYCDLKRGDHYNNYLQHAFNKYKNVYCKILIECEYEDLSKQESHFIHLHNSLSRNKGYNLTDETEGGKKLSNKTKEKLRNFNLGKTLPQETKNKISESMIGTKRSTESRLNYSKSKLGDKNPMFGKLPPNTISVIQYDLEGNEINTFKSMSEASKKTGILLTTIFNIIHGKTKKPKHYIWKRKN